MFKKILMIFAVTVLFFIVGFNYGGIWGVDAKQMKNRLFPTATPIPPAIINYKELKATIICDNWINVVFQNEYSKALTRDDLMSACHETILAEKFEDWSDRGLIIGQSTARKLNCDQAFFGQNMAENLKEEIQKVMK